MPLEPGQKLSHYRLVEKIGEGGMGVVWKARDEKLRRDVALKVLPAELVEDPERRRRLLREARSAAAINHPNIGTVHEVDEAEGTVFIAMELVEGKTLRSLLGGQPLPIPEALRIATEIGEGLVAAHQASVIHRDLKPENILIRPDGHVKILDFGLARVHEAPQPADSQPSQVETVTQRMTREGHVLGTPAYMSPEQARGETIDARSDIFSFGVLVYEVVTGEVPFQGRTNLDTLSAILNKPAIPPSRLNADVLPELERILSKCLEKDPKNRYQTTEDLAVDLTRLERQVESGAAASFEKIVKAPTRRADATWMTGRWTLAAVALTTIAIVVAYYWLGHGKVPARSSDSAPPRVTPFLTGPALHKQPAWSPTGNFIAYVSDASGNDDIWICDASGSSLLNLTEDFTGADSHPAWSPDGQRIAFFSERDGGGIFSMTPLGGEVRKRVGLRNVRSLNWARNGHLIYDAADETERSQVFRLSELGREPDCLTCQLGIASGQLGELSPRGDLLAFKSTESGPVGSLYVGHLPTASLNLVDELGLDEPHWSPEGNRIFFISGREGTPDLWVLEVDPNTGARIGNPKRLTSAMNLSDFSLDRDGRRFLAERSRDHANLWSFPSGLERVSDFDVGEALTTGQFFDGRPRMAPEHGAIFFESDRRGSLDIWKLTLPARDLVRVTSSPLREGRPRASPDGSWIAFDVEGDQGLFVHVMRPDGSQVHILDRQFPERFHFVCCTDWSPDGSRLAATFRDRDLNFAIGVITINQENGTAGEIRLFDTPGGGQEYPRWSLDGRFLVYEAYLDGSWDLWVISSDGENPQRLTSAEGAERQGAWSPYSRFIYFIKDERSIWRIPVDESGTPKGPASPWATPTRRSRFAIDSIDFMEDRVVVSLVDMASEIWLVEMPEE